MGKQLLTFRPTDEEEELFDKEGGFSKFVHTSAQNKINEKKNNFYDRLGNKLLLILLGISFVMISLFIINLAVFITLLGVAFFSIGFGTMGILKEFRHGR